MHEYDKDYVVFLKDKQDFTYEQIGNKLNKSKEAVRSMYRRAKGIHEKKPPKSSYQSYNISAEEQIKVAFPTDIHVPFHDEYAIELALRLIDSFNPDVLICGSDAIDFYAVSRFDKNPERKEQLQNEIDDWIKVQEAFNDAAPNSSKKYLIGNHEDRLKRYLWKHAELADLRALKLENLLELEQLGIGFIGDEVVINDVLVVKHGNRIRKESAYTARAELEVERYSVNIMSGHTHRGGTHYATSRRGVFRADECFCLCDVTPEYVKNPNWQQGLTLATVVNDVVSIEAIPFSGKGKNMVAFWRGDRYTVK